MLLKGSLANTTNVSQAGETVLMSPVLKRQKSEKMKSKSFFVFFVFFKFTQVRIYNKGFVSKDSCFKVLQWLVLFVKIGCFWKKLYVVFGGGEIAL